MIHDSTAERRPCLRATVKPDMRVQAVEIESKCSKQLDDTFLEGKCVEADPVDVPELGRHFRFIDATNE